MSSEAWVSPLVEIERAVQRRAKDVELDLATAEGAEKLEVLVAEEIEHWVEEHRRGRRPAAIAEPKRLAERAVRNLIGYGPLEPLLGIGDERD